MLILASVCIKRC